MSIEPAPKDLHIEIDEDGVFGHVYVQCQWGHCQECEPHPPYQKPEGWGTHNGDWFCAEHLKAARYEDALGETEWTIGVPQCFGKTLLKTQKRMGSWTTVVKEIVVDA